MAEAVYFLCAITSLSCAVLLFRTFVKERMRLLLWSGLCFLGFAVNNGLLFVDLVLVPDVALFPWRSAAALLGVGVLLYGLILEAP